MNLLQKEKKLMLQENKALYCLRQLKKINNKNKNDKDDVYKIFIMIMIIKKTHFKDNLIKTMKHVCTLHLQ